MCQSNAQGGKRCAAHTRPAYANAPFGTDEWDRAAAEHAATPAGRSEVGSDLAAARTASDREPLNVAAVERVAALTAALRRGDALSAAFGAARTGTTALASTGGGATAPTPPDFEPPVLVLAEAFHVGDLNPELRKGESYEGSGLSVSVHPDDWVRIARLGTPARWSLTRRGGAPLRFVDWHTLGEGERDALREWAHAQGWIEQRHAYRVSWYDDEVGDTLSTDFDDEGEALDEADSLEGDVSTMHVWRPTDSFPEGRLPAGVDPTDMLLATWVRTHRPDLDGVWWDDTYNPAALSCPRGVLVQPLSHYACGAVSDGGAGVEDGGA